MGFTSSFNVNTPIINDSTPDQDLVPPPGRSTGLELERRTTPYGAIRNAERFPRELLIPRSEWQARIQEREEKKIRLRDISDAAALPIKDQDGLPYCHVEDTEVLTEKGWVAWPNYNWIDLLATVNPVTGMLEYQPTLAKHAYRYKGPVIYSTNCRVDFGVTPEHRMLVRPWDEQKRTLSDSYRFQVADKIGWYCGLMPNPTGYLGTDLVEIEIEGDRRYDGDDFLALLALVCSDGYAGSPNSPKGSSYVGFCCFHEDRYPMVAALAQRVGFKEQPSRKGVWVRYSAHALANWVRANCYLTGSQTYKSHTKRVPDLVKIASKRQVHHFLQFFGDQRHSCPTSEGKVYYSTGKRMIDDLQELCLKVGKRGRIYCQVDPSVTVMENGQEIHSRHPMYIMGVAEKDRLCLNRKKHIERESYDGMVYCASVPNGTLITRRNGTMLISGNCWIFGPTKAVEIIRLIQGQPMISLSATSVGAQIKNFREEGGWGQEGLEFIAEHGIIPESLWPECKLRREYLTEENKKVGQQYRCTEWWELKPRDLDEHISVLLRGFPVAVGLNYWGHEVCDTDALWIDGEIAVSFDNSWAASWGDKGRGIRQGSRLLADDAVTPRVMMAT